jgi:hypothetical protein
MRLLEEVSLVMDEELTAEGSVPYRLVHSIVDHDRDHWHEIAAKLAGMPAHGIQPAVRS